MRRERGENTGETEIREEKSRGETRLTKERKNCPKARNETAEI